MRGDFSRIRLSRGKGYTSVLEQQGRVALDADANEQRFLDGSLRRRETIDVIGQFGGPVGDDGFTITVAGGQVMIGAGRYYVDGLLVENPSPVSYDAQPFFAIPAGAGASLLADLRQGGVAIQFYLRVWQRLVTAVDDPCLREPALGQADTTARLQTVWQVIGERVQFAAGEPAGACCAAMYTASSAPPPATTGTLTVSTGGASADCGCGPVAAAGYQGLENQLYRVEIHGGGDTAQGPDDGPTFKWSRENGSVVAAVTGLTGQATLQVDSVGPDANLGFEALQWVEVTDDSYTLGLTPNAPGPMYQIQSVDKDDPSLTLTSAVIETPGANARVRRWDQSGQLAQAAGGAIPLPVNTSYPLENGIAVSFSAGVYQSGDYWTFAARTATGTVEWPECGGDGNQAQPPQSVPVRTAPLACMHWEQGKVNSNLIIENCRRAFSPLTALTPSGAAQAIHVQSISWANDDIMTLDQLVVNGLTVTLDQAVSGPVNGANFVVAIEPVTRGTVSGAPAGSAASLADMLAKPAPSAGKSRAVIIENLTILRAVEILDSEIAVAGGSVAWMLPFGGAVGLIQQSLSLSASEGHFARARVRLLGEKFFAAGAAGPIYLDGRAFGQAGTKKDGTPRIDLSFPSGSGSPASDLESWFYLAPVLTVASASVTYPSLTGVVNVGGGFAGVEQTPAAAGTVGPLVNQVATVTLNYPALAPATVNLTLTSDNAGAGTVVSIPASVTVAQGQGFAQFPVTVSAAPQSTINFTITASLSTVIPGVTTSQTVTFALVGPPVRES